MASKDNFVLLPHWFLDHSDLSLQELAVYIVLLRFRNPSTGECFPGMATIADRARVSRETVKRVIPLLEQRSIVRVKREKVDGRNMQNVYTVALPAREQPARIWETSAMGTRSPKRSKRRHSETPPLPKEGGGRHSETPPRHSETLGVGTPSASKKTKYKKTNEEDIRPTLPSGHDNYFTFDDDQPISEKQLDYLNDLHVNLTHRPVDKATRTRWTKLPQPEIAALVARYWEQIPRGRGGNWEGVTEDDPAWEYLSESGRIWYDNGAVPEGALSWAS